MMPTVSALQTVNSTQSTNLVNIRVFAAVFRAVNLALPCLVVLPSCAFITRAAMGGDFVQVSFQCFRSRFRVFRGELI